MEANECMLQVDEVQEGCMAEQSKNVAAIAGVEGVIHGKKCPLNPRDVCGEKERQRRKEREGTKKKGWMDDSSTEREQAQDRSLLGCWAVPRCWNA